MENRAFGYALIALALAIIVRGEGHGHILADNFIDSPEIPLQDIQPQNDDLNSKPNFNVLEERNQPLHLCTSIDDGIKWALPQVPHCSVYAANASVKEHSFAANITTWWPLLTSQDLDGWECYAKYFVSRKSWFVDFTYSEEEHTYDHPITIDHCREMLKTHLSPNKTRLESHGSGLYATTSGRETKYSYGSTDKVEWTEFYLQKFTVAVRPDNQDVVTAAELVEPCVVRKGFCETKRGWLLWDEKLYKSCYLKEGPKAPCAVTNGLITCPSISMAQSHIHLTKVCGIMFGTGDQKVLFTAETPIWEGAATSDDVTPLLVPLQQSRPKRSTEAQFGNQASYDAELEFVYQLIRNSTNSAVLEIHHTICRTNAMVVNGAISQAKAGSPSLLVETFYGPGYKAKWLGDVLGVIKCHKIYYYRFLTRTECTEDYPVEYSFSPGNETRVGYLTPGHEIRNTYTPIDCGKMGDYYFTYGGRSYMLNNRNTDMRIRTLVNPGLIDRSQIHLLGEIAIKGPAIYSADEFADSDTVNKLRWDIHQADKVRKAVKGYNEHGSEYRDETGFLKGLQNTVFGPVLEWLKIAGVVIAAILILVILLFVMIKCQFFFRILGCMNTIFCKCTGKNKKKSEKTSGKNKKKSEKTSVNASPQKVIIIKQPVNGLLNAVPRNQLYPELPNEDFEV